ncbi:phospholipase [bacterium]|nr:phospholipase [bacterium]MBU1675589.1 phospholipase [bacterium]
MSSNGSFIALMLILAAPPVLAADSPAADPPLLHGNIRLVESVPVETVLDLPDLPDARDVWPVLIAGARSTLDIEVFYISADPAAPDALDVVLAEVAAAAERGVRVRLLTDAGFYRTYPQWVDEIGALPGAESRLLDARAAWGGVQHAKFFVVDGRAAFVGSQNWDWRSLDHIHELGVRIDGPEPARAILSIFEWDWALAGDEAPPRGAPVNAGPWRMSVRGRGEVLMSLAASPPAGLPAGIPHDEPLLVDLIDGAQRELRLHLLSYNPSDREGRYYETLENALRRAAARGVQVRIILSNWSKRKYMQPYAKSLAVLDNVEVRFTDIPPWSSGFVSFARVEHPKYLVKDGDAAWLGTANWGRSYFHTSRNLSFFFAGEAVAADMARFFDNSWNSPYAETVDPGKDYTPPRREE